MTPPPIHCYPHQPPPAPIRTSIVHLTPQKDHEDTCPATQHHPTQTTHHNPPQPPFVLLPRFGYEKRMKIFYFPRFQNGESMSSFKMTGSISVFKASISMFKKCIKYTSIFKKCINIYKTYQYSKQVYRYSRSMSSTSIFLRSISIFKTSI